ncbi:MAG TPA: hypothetical protein VFF73_08045 [Planctomycetota bacterium]|nr:hypothetical protein [Planctomycetota bacterium]
MRTGTNWKPLAKSGFVVVVAFAVISTLRGSLRAEDQVTTPEWSPAGQVKIDRNTAQVLFSEEEKDYRIDVSVSLRADEPPTNADRIEVWLLSKGGKAVSCTKRDNGALCRVSTNHLVGGTESAMFFFDHSVDRKDLVALVVSVDAEPTLCRIPKKPSDTDPGERGKRLMRITEYTGLDLDKVKLVRDALRAAGERSEEFFIPVNDEAMCLALPHRGGGEVCFPLWHETALDTKNENVPGNPGGKCRNAFLDPKTKKVRFALWK